MPGVFFKPGDPCYCHASVCNEEGWTLHNLPLFVLLEAYGQYYFAPGFSKSPDSYLDTHAKFDPGETRIIVIPEFYWPDTGTSADNVRWIAALTDPEVTRVIGSVGTLTFGWR